MRFSNGKLYGLVPCQAYQDERLSKPQLRLLLALLCHADAEGRCQLKRAQFSRELGVPESQISEATQALLQLGWLDRPDKGEHSKAWTYRVKTPDSAGLRAMETVSEAITVADRTVTEWTSVAAGAATQAVTVERCADSGPWAEPGVPAAADDAGEQPPAESADASPDPVVITIPLLGREGEFAVTESMVLEWQDAFPGVDVRHTLKRIRLWCLDNPARRKTRRGARRFLTGWLARDQDRGGGAKAARGPDWFKGAL